MLPVALQVEILRLHFAEGLSRGRIARLLRVNRKTVAAVIRRRQVATERAEPCRRTSILTAHVPLIEKLVQDAPARSAVNVLQRLRAAGYQGGITILRDYLRSRRPEPQREAFLTLDFAPGEAAQVDWGELGDAFGNGTKASVFVMVLCSSRMLYLEFTLRETLPALLRCYERALRFFAGRCHEYWHDNMPTVVAERVGKLARFTPAFLAYAGFHGFRPVLCNVRKPHEKGRVEDGVKLVRHQFWPGRHFTDIDGLNRQACQWRDGFANRREHQTTRKVPELLFQAERGALLPLRPDPYDTDDVISAKVSPSFRIRFETNDYSVPWTLVGRPVTLRADDRQVRIFYTRHLVARHDRCYLKGQQICNPAHEEGLRERKAAASRSWELDTVASFGPSVARYLQLIQAGHRSLRAELRDLLCLATVYGAAALEHTVASLLSQGMVGLSHIERALRLSHATPKAPPPLTLADTRLAFVPPIPNLQAYDTLLLEARHAPSPDDEEDQ